MGSFAPVAESILFDDEYLDLDPDHQHIWLTLIISPAGGRCGIYKFGFHALTAQCKRSREVIEQALAEFKRLGWIERDDAGFIWIKNRIKYRDHNKDWAAGAVKEASEMLDKTPLAAACVKLYSYIEPAKPRNRKVTAGEPDENPNEPQDNHGVTAGEPRVTRKEKNSIDRKEKNSIDIAPSPNGSAPAAQDLILTAEESDIIEVLNSVPGKPVDRQNALDGIHAMRKLYPNLDLLQVAAKMRDSYLGDAKKPRKICGNKRLAFRNWCGWRKDDKDCQLVLSDSFDLRGYRPEQLKPGATW